MPGYPPWAVMVSAKLRPPACDADEFFARAGSGFGNLADFEDLRASEAGYHDGFHGRESSRTVLRPQNWGRLPDPSQRAESLLRYTNDYELSGFVVGKQELVDSIRIIGGPMIVSNKLCFVVAECQ